MSRAALCEGMLLTADVVDQAGRPLLAAGTSLTGAHLELLKTWGIADVSVDDRSVPRDAAGIATRSPTAALTPEQEQQLRERFRHVDLDHPMCRELLAQSLLRARGRTSR